MAVYKQIFKKINKVFKNPTIVNILIVAIVTLFVKGIGFVKEIVIADNLGLSELLDTYYIAVLIPGFMSNVFLESFKSVFIPNYVTELKVGSKIGAFQSTYLIVTLGVSILFCLVALLVTDTYLDIFFGGHTDGYYALVKTQFYYVLPCIIFWGLTSLINGLLNVDDEFKLSSLSSIFIPISIIICLLFFKDKLGNAVLAFGTLIGSIIGFLFILSVALKRRILHLETPDFVSKNIKLFFSQIPAKLSASLLTGLNGIVDQFFAAQLIIGSIAALNYGVKITMFAIGIVTISLGNVLLPYFSKKAIENKDHIFNDLKKILKITLIGTLIVSLLLIVISKPIITLVFERNAFTSDDTIVVSKIQQMYLLQIPAYISGIIMVRFLTSINKNSFMALAAVVRLTLNIGLNYFLIKKLGVYGLALATSIVVTLNSIMLWSYIKYSQKTLKT